MFSVTSFMQELCDGIAGQFGSNCEVVYHDLTKDYEHTIVAIANGHVTGRTVGGPGTNEGLKALKKAGEGGSTYTTYLSHTKEGKTLRSTSIYIHDKKGNIIGSLCINYDITDIMYLQNTLSELTSTPQNSNECFASDISEVLDSMINDSINYIGKPITRMTRNDKVNAIRYLDDHGAFLVKRSCERVCELFCITKHSFYAYLEEVRR
jgi:predicted transcriptional regulator YheO